MGFFGNVFGGLLSFVAEKTADAIEWVVEQISHFFSDSSKTIGNTDSYDKDTASMGQTKQLNDELAKIKNQAVEYGENLEDEFLEIGEEQIENLIKQIRQVDSINTSNFKEQCDNILREFRGTVAKNIASKMSLSDDEFLEIAELPKGKKRKRKCTLLAAV